VGTLEGVGVFVGPVAKVAVGKTVTVGLGCTMGGGGVKVSVGIAVKVGGEVGVGEGVDVFVGGGITRSMTELHPTNNTVNKSTKIKKWRSLERFIFYPPINPSFIHHKNQ